MRGYFDDVAAGDGADQIDVMDGHVEEKREFHLLAKTAGEIGRDIEIEVSVTDRSDFVLGDKLPYFLDGGMVAVLLADHELKSLFPGQLDHFAGVLDGIGNRL